MHIPDGFLDTKTWATCYVVSGGFTAYALYRAREVVDKAKKIPMLGITAAFIFAAQMLNFPVAAGTSGHFLGAMLACVLLGPWEGYLTMVVVLLVQCLFFGDGGLTALGANILNMGVIGGLLCFFLFSVLKVALARRAGEKGAILASVAVLSWFSVVLASAVCSVQLAISGTVPFSEVLPAMVGVHSLIGIGEAIITVVVVSVVLQARPDLVYAYEKPVMEGGLTAGEVA